MSAPTESKVAKEGSSGTQVRPPAPGNFLFTSESVNEGHPDKLCDQVSDAVLDACLREDKHSRVACESCSKTGMVMVFGEITTASTADIDQVVRDACEKIGYNDVDVGLDFKTMEVLNKLEEQSPDIKQGVDARDEQGNAVEDPHACEKVGAGDQGHMFGYATDETEEFMPLTHSIATRLGKRLTDVRKGECGALKPDGKTPLCPWVRPDGKTQVTIEYKRCQETGAMLPQRVHTILISTQHHPDITNEKIAEDLMEHVVRPVVDAKYLDADTIYHFNPSGRFVIGGPHGDAGLTGRKIIIDTYGGWGAHGGGAFSGKDTTKVDRSAAYAARWAAKSLVKGGFCKRALVQTSYAIGVAQPLSMFVDTYGSVTRDANGNPICDDETLCEIVKRNFDFRPGCIQRDLRLKEPQFQQLAAYGHMGRHDLPEHDGSDKPMDGHRPLWENVVDLAEEMAALTKAVQAAA